VRVLALVLDRQHARVRRDARPAVESEGAIQAVQDFDKM
jgi:hypothetical protein